MMNIYITFNIYFIVWCLSMTTGFMLSLYDDLRAENKDDMKPVVADKNPFY